MLFAALRTVPLLVAYPLITRQLDSMASGRFFFATGVVDFAQMILLPIVVLLVLASMRQSRGMRPVPAAD